MTDPHDVLRYTSTCYPWASAQAEVSDPRQWSSVAGSRSAKRLRVALGTAVVMLVLFLIVFGRNGAAQSEFAGESWYQGHVFVCKAPGHCTPLTLPTPTRQPVYLEFRQASEGAAYGSFAMDNDGRFGWWAAPTTYLVTLKPARLYGLHAGTTQITITANHGTAFDLAYGRLK